MQYHTGMCPDYYTGVLTYALHQSNKRFFLVDDRGFSVPLYSNLVKTE